METNGGRETLPSGHKTLWCANFRSFTAVQPSKSKSTMVSVFARLRFRTTALFLLAAAPGCITPSSFSFAHLYEKENGVMTPPVTAKPANSPTTNPTTTPPLTRTTGTPTSWASSFLDAAFDVLSTHTVSHQLRSLLSPLLMPQQPAVPSKVIFIEGQKNWTNATALVAMFDDNYNDLSTTAPYVDPCRITQYDLGFPLGFVAQYGGFFQSAYAPACIPRVKNSCATFFEAPLQYLLDMLTNDDAQEEIGSYILRAELEEAFYNWTHDQLDTYRHSLYDQLDTFHNWTSDQLDAIYNWTSDQLDAFRHSLYDQYVAAHQWLHDNKIVAGPQWWNNQLCSVLHWFWRCLIQNCIIDNVIGWVVVFQNACVAAVVYLRDTVVQWAMVCVEVVGFVRDVSVEVVIGLKDEAVFRIEIASFYCHDIYWWFQLPKTVLAILLWPICYCLYQFIVKVFYPVVFQVDASLRKGLREIGNSLHPGHAQVPGFVNSKLPKIIYFAKLCYLENRPDVLKKLPALLYSSILRYNPGVTAEQVQAAMNSIPHQPGMANELRAMYNKMVVGLYLVPNGALYDDLKEQFQSLCHYKLQMRALVAHGLVDNEWCHPEAYKLLFLADWIHATYVVDGGSAAARAFDTGMTPLSIFTALQEPDLDYP
jgi:hypothetical protein